MSQHLPQVTPQSVSSTDGYAKSVLSVSLINEDHQALEHLLPRHTWTVHKASNISAALAFMRDGEISVVICDSDSIPAWKELLEKSAELPLSASVIVAARLADERLWCEALHRGAYDVVAKPLVASEVTRVVASAWHRWQNEHDVPLKFSNRMPAGISA